jgi:hypothetical protein
MVTTRDADAQKTAVWAGLDVLGKSRPHLLLEGESPNTYLARWQSSPVPAHVLAGRLRRALPGSKVLTVRSFPGRATVRPSTQSGRIDTRHNVSIEFALGLEPDVPEETKRCAVG